MFAATVVLPGAGYCQITQYKDDVPLESPYYNERYVAGWVSRLAMKVMSLSFTQLEYNIRAAEKDFTKEAYEIFISELEAADMPVFIKNNRVIMKAAPQSKARLISKGLLNGRYTWAFELPVLLTYQTHNETYRENKKITAIVVRSNEPNHNMIAVNHWFVEDSYEKVKRPGPSRDGNSKGLLDRENLMHLYKEDPRPE
jgi:hypothetical protein